MFSLCHTSFLALIAALPLVSIEPAHAKDDGWKFELAAGAGAVPRYSGSKEYQAAPMLSFDVTAPGGWFFGTSGLGWGTTIGDNAKVRAYIGASGIRYDKNSVFGGSDYLRGMGDIKSRALVGMAGGYTIGEAVISASVQYAPQDKDRGENGLATKQGQLSVEMPLFDFAGGAISGSLSTEYGDSGYMQTWYGVTQTQARRTGFARHTPDAGLVSAGIGVKWSRQAGENGNWFVSAEAKRLLGDAAKSPVVQKANQFGLMTGYSHSF
jgi:outer membrane scaffolding protein for murein synthesis (MipA/OmpV family)